MTDEELNRAVAEARGWGQEEDQGFSVYGSHLVWFDKDWRKVDPELFDVCTDPAAWGGLLEEMSKESSQVVLRHTYGSVDAWQAAVWRGHSISDASASSPGRALAKAFLASKGVEG